MLFSVLRMLFWWVVLPALCGVPVLHASRGWETLEGCRLSRNDSNDADSFHVRHGGKDYIFRLYFVDAPETSKMVPSRVREQATVFGISQERVLVAGEQATKFALGHLKRPFTVRTRWQDARGQSALPRNYAFVETADGRDLGELLAEAGHARSYGAAAAPPGKQVERLRQRYDRLEQKAKRAGLGAWGDGKKKSTPAGPDDVDGEPGQKSAESAAEPAPGGLMAEIWGSAMVESEPVAEPAPPVSEAPPTEPVVKPGVTKDGKVDLNHATAAELQTLPGIDAATAEAIVAARPFAGSHELLRVSGVTPTTLKQIFPLIVE